MNIEAPSHFTSDFGGNDLPTVITEASRYISQRNKAIQQIEHAASLLQQAYELSARAIGSVQVATQSEGYVFRYAHDRNPDYRSLFNDGFDPNRASEAFKRTVDSEIWGKLISVTGIEALMDAEALKSFRGQLASDVPEVTEDNLKATLETLYSKRDEMFLRGVANVFSKLDRRFKSHDAFKVGSRIIIQRFLPYESGFSSHCNGALLLNDVDRVVRKLLGKADSPGYLSMMLDRAQGGSTWTRKPLFYENDYAKIRVFLNGNAHLYLSDIAQEAVNSALARFYGEAIPDGAPAGMNGADFSFRYSVPTKDFAFYQTPAAAADTLTSKLSLWKGMRILEPSAGTGALISAVHRRIAERSGWRGDYCVQAKDVSIDAVELHPARCEILRASFGDRCTIVQGNFLDSDAWGTYDAIIMNPPFHGTSYMDHLYHALEHLKPGGELLAIVPVTAAIGSSPRHAQLHRLLDRNCRYTFSDLPIGAFSESGTMISTTVLHLHKNSSPGSRAGGK